MKPRIGVVGTGFVGGSLANNLDSRGLGPVVRYSLEPEYSGNREAVTKCDLVFVAVPTPTVAGEFRGKVLKDTVGMFSEDTVVAIRSTVPPWFVYRMHGEMGRPPRILVVPEFLDASTAQEDTDAPDRNIVGVRDLSDMDDQRSARMVLDVLPKAGFERVCSWGEASLAKYAGNGFFFMKNAFFNFVHDLAEALNLDPETVREAVAADPRIGPVHTYAVDKGGRGAGGPCLPKDFAVLREMSEQSLPKMYDPIHSVLYHAERRNRKLLEGSGKDGSIVKEVYG